MALETPRPKGRDEAADESAQEVPSTPAWLVAAAEACQRSASASTPSSDKLRDENARLAAKAEMESRRAKKAEECVGQPSSRIKEPWQLSKSARACWTVENLVSC